ncbi:hypothetical protein [Caballeronia sordidicola]|uniref:hypothetical protein n=1 Tax=Caballeronia sordidicola TaxID=196367 RepID=UPI0004D02FAF|nr:hypothetical protein [Caballeronia sordidicola]
MYLYLTLNDFDTVSSTLKVRIRLDGGSMSGTWSKLEDTLGGKPGFPGDGHYRWDEGGIDLLYDDDETGKKDVVLCQMLGLSPGVTKDPRGTVAIIGERLSQYTTANWSQAEEETE